MVKQASVDRRNVLKRFWKEMGKMFLIITGMGWVICLAVPRFHVPIAFLVCALIGFSVAFVFLFRKKEQRREFEGDR